MPLLPLREMNWNTDMREAANTYYCYYRCATRREAACGIPHSILPRRPTHQSTINFLCTVQAASAEEEEEEVAAQAASAQAQSSCASRCTPSTCVSHIFCNSSQLHGNQYKHAEGRKECRMPQGMRKAARNAACRRECGIPQAQAYMFVFDPNAHV